MNKEVTNIESDVIFKGTFQFRDQLIVKGNLFGEISGNEGIITIEAHGLIDGAVIADTIENRGTLKGKATVNHYFITSLGINDCDLILKDIMVERGAKMSGLLSMVTED